MKPTLRLALAAVVSAIAPAAAQTPPHTPGQPPPATPAATASQAVAGEAVLGVEILDPDQMVVADEVRGAIGAELAIRVADGAVFAPRLGRLEIAIEHGVVDLAYHPAAGTMIERTLALPLVPADRVQLIAFVATNLVRDQAREILGGLPSVVPPPVPSPPARQQAPQPRSSPTKSLAVTVGLVPPLALDRAFDEPVAVGFGLHAVMGRTEQTKLATISGVADVVDGPMTGAQIGGAVAATVGPVRGVQVGGAVVVARGSVEGAQIAGATSVAHQVSGLQISGAVSVANDVDGAQIAGGLNVGGDVRGLQLGVINVARRMRGVQLGVVNLSDDGDDSIPIGIINYSRNGGIALDTWIDSSRVSAIAFRHGTKHVHNIWSIGWSPDHDAPLLGVGLGVSRQLAPSLGLDIAALHWLTDAWDLAAGQIDQLRASVSVPLAHGVEVFGGVAANVYIDDVMADASADFHPTLDRTFAPSSATTVVLWPSAFAGVRIRARP